MSVATTGCITPCPFHDPFENQPPVTTASADGVRQSGVPGRLPETIGEPKPVPGVSGEVSHRPLYFEDPHEVIGSDDGKLAWTGEDYAYIFTGPARFLLNFFTVPFEMIVYPPWDVMASDGVADRKVAWWWVDSRPFEGDPHNPCESVIVAE